MGRDAARGWLGILAGVVTLVLGLAPPVLAQETSTGVIEGHTEVPPGLATFSTCVAAQRTSGPFVGSTTADLLDGSFSLSVPPGSYAIWYWPCGRNAEYGPAASLYRDSFSYDTTTVVTVAAGQTVSLQEQATPAPGARAEGSVLEADGTPAVPCRILAYTRTAIPTPLSRATVGSDGRYLVPSLPTGTYDLVADCGPAFFPTFYGNTADPSESVGVDVVGGELTSGLDFVPIQRPRSASGRLTRADGSHAPGTCVWAVDAAGNVLRRVNAGDRDGYWSMADLPVGDVWFAFAGCRGDRVYIPEWFDDAPSQAEGTPVEISATAPASQIDAVIATLDDIQFIFSDANGNPVTGVCVWVTDLTGTTLVTAAYESGDNVLVSGLAAGDYSVLFTDCGGTGFAPEWFEDSATHAGSTPVTAQDGIVPFYRVVL